VLYHTLVKQLVERRVLNHTLLNERRVLNHTLVNQQVERRVLYHTLVNQLVERRVLYHTLVNQLVERRVLNHTLVNERRMLNHTLVNQLVERMLSVGARLAPRYRSSHVVDAAARASDVLAVGLHVTLLEVRCKPMHVLQHTHQTVIFYTY